MNKICTQCDYIKPLDMFPKSMTTLDGYYEVCKSCFTNGNKPALRIDPTPVAPIAPRNEQPTIAAAWGQQPEYMSTPYIPKKRGRIPKPKRTEEEKLQIARAWSYNNHYGLSLEGWENIKASQDNKCAICRKVPTGEKQFGILVVDYDKHTDTVRGAVCRHCKLGLSSFPDSDRLFKAIEYLEKSNK
ncbi:MAG: endonuclease domain-containing protein [Candidatus Babeliales bacterium]